jgi:RNA polymerase sigma factor (sigma-70 family)
METGEFTRQYEAVRVRLFNFLLRLCGDRTEAEEIFSEAVARAWKGRHGFRRQSGFSTWIYAIALNAHRSSARGGRRTIPLEDAAEAVLADPRPNPEHEAARREEGARLGHAVLSLAENYRLPLLLRHTEDLSFREIGDMLGITEELARVRTHRARHALVEMLREER